MKKKWEQAKEDKDSLQRLERRYAKWKAKQRLEKILEIEVSLEDELDYVDLDKQWQ